MLPRTLKRLLLCVVSVFFVLIAAAGGWYMWSWDPLGLRTPSDRHLVALFQTHRAEFNHLREMAIDDSVVIRNISKVTLAHCKLPTDRREEYIRLFSSIYPKLNVIVAPPSAQFIFACGSIGFSLAPEWCKGITFLPPGQEEGAQIVESLDRLPRNAPYGDYLVRLEPNWYVFVSKRD